MRLASATGGLSPSRGSACLFWSPGGRTCARVYTPTRVGVTPATPLCSTLPTKGRHVCVDSAPGLPLVEEGVLVAVRRGTAAEESQRRRRPDLMPRTRWNQCRITGTDRPALAVDLQVAGSLEHEVDLLGASVVVTLGRLS